MLLNLHVKNLALIDEVEVDFFDHLNILTGETGAGKSILIGSIQAALGGKVSKDLIRRDAPYALIELLFHVENQEVEEQLKQKEIYLEDRQLRISRKIMPNKNVCRINGEVVTLSLLREVSSLLMDLHGQQENLTLMYSAKQLDILDQYIGKEAYELREEIQEAYNIYRRDYQEYKQLLSDGDHTLREVSFLEYEVKEINEASLKIGEDVLLEQQYKKLEHSKQIMSTLSRIYQTTSEQLGTNIAEQLGLCTRELSTISHMDDSTRNLYDQMSQLEALMSDFNRDLADYMEDMYFDEQTYREMDERLNTINQLKAKYGNSIEKILNYAEETQARLDKFSDMESYKERLKRTYEQSLAKVLQLSEKLSQLRKKTAVSLTEQIKKVLMDLNFLQVQFQIEFQKLKEPTELGTDEIVFLISTNPGMPLRPIAQVASGGELSRIMLAVKSVLADVDHVDTLIFDEIDTGVSGRTAQMVAEKLNVIAKHHQVICITHLPQIAAMADTHFLIEKEIEGNVTRTLITMLHEQESVEELARLLSGAQVTEAVRKNAKEMIALAKSQKEY